MPGRALRAFETAGPAQRDKGSVPGRLAVYLLYLSDKNGSIEEFELDIAKSQLASLLGTIPETLSRIFTRLSQNDLIRIQGPKIAILDRVGLEDLAEGETKL